MMRVVKVHHKPISETRLLEGPSRNDDQRSVYENCKEGPDVVSIIHKQRFGCPMSTYSVM